MKTSGDSQNENNLLYTRNYEINWAIYALLKYCPPVYRHKYLLQSYFALKK